MFKSNLKKHQRSLVTRDLILENINLFLHKVEHWVRQMQNGNWCHGV